jgi:hypothetical protein
LQAFYEQGNWFSGCNPKNRAEHQMLSELHNSQGNSLLFHYQTNFSTGILNPRHKKGYDWLNVSRLERGQYSSAVT